MDYIVESIKIMAALLFLSVTEYLTGSAAVVKLEYLPLLATP